MKLEKCRYINENCPRKVEEKIFLHDLSNSILGIYSTVQIIQDEHSNYPSGLINDLLFCTEQLVNEIKAYKISSSFDFEPEDLYKENINLYDFIVNLSKPLKNHSANKGKFINIQEPNNICKIYNRQSILSRVLTNLLKNALEASEINDTVKIELNNNMHDSCLICIHNSGAIPEHIKQYLFNHSISTKSKNRGLGIPSAKYLTQKYLKGDLTFISEPSIGTKFYLSLPLSI